MIFPNRSLFLYYFDKKTLRLNCLNAIFPNYEYSLIIDLEETPRKHISLNNMFKIGKVMLGGLRFNISK